MSDRTWVQLSMSAKDHEFLKKNTDFFERETPELEEVLGDDVTLNYEQCNYGELDDDRLLRALSIPFIREWDSGDDYPKGAEYFNILGNGEIKQNIFNSSDMADMVDLGAIKNLLETGTPESISKFVQEELIKNYVLSWPLQLKISKARREAINELSQLPIEQLKDKHATLLNNANEDIKEAISKNQDSYCEYDIPENLQLATDLLEMGYMTPILSELQSECLTDFTAKTTLKLSSALI